MKTETTLKKAALITAVSLLIMVMLAPFAELYIMPKLVVPYKTAETAQNIIENQSLFIAAIFSYLITFILDFVIAWGIYVLMKPVSRNLALFTAGFRVIYTILALVALNNLITAFQLLTTTRYLEILETSQIQNLAMVSLRAFKNHWYFALIFFGIHLILLGVMVIRSKYISQIVGWLLLIAGAGYLLTSVRPYLLPNVNVDFAKYTFYGEIIFMLWLFIRGYKLKEQEY